MMHEGTTPNPTSDPDNPLVQAIMAESEFAAQTKAAVLEDEGIETYVFAAERSWTGGLSLDPLQNGVPVWVRQSDLERAKHILAQRIADSVDLDWDEVDVGEPEGELPDAPASVNFSRLIAILGWIAGVAIVLLAIAAVSWNLIP